MRIVEIELKKTHAFTQYAPLSAMLRAELRDDDSLEDAVKALSAEINKALLVLHGDRPGGGKEEPPKEEPPKEEPPKKEPPKEDPPKRRGRPKGSKNKEKAEHPNPGLEPDGEEEAPVEHPALDQERAPAEKPAAKPAARPAPSLRKKCMLFAQEYGRATTGLPAGERRALADKLGVEHGPQESFGWTEDKVDRARRILAEL